MTTSGGDPGASELTAPGGTDRPERELGRSTRNMAIGTVASRGTGFLRNAAIAAVLGVHTTALASDTLAASLCVVMSSSSVGPCTVSDHVQPA